MRLPGLYLEDDLFPAICDFTNHRREPDEDDPKLIRTLPSLWHELLQSVDQRTGRGRGGAHPAPPVATAVLSLVDEIERACLRELLSAGQPAIVRWVDGVPVRDVPAELRRINSLLTVSAPDAAARWAELVDQWAARADQAMRHDSDLQPYLRGVSCIDCGHDRVLIPTDTGEEVLQPALRLIWRDRRVHYVWCAVCGSSRWSADLHLIAERNGIDNLTKETLGL